jgi:hemolysin III
VTAAHSRPRLRGVLHQYAFFAALGAALLLVFAAPTPRARFAVTIYGLTFTALFGVSALFHRVTWSVRARRWMGRLDHAMINLMIAGTITPYALLLLSGTMSLLLLIVVWGGALIGILVHTLWIDAPKWLSAVLYLLIGWSGTMAGPELVPQVGWTAIVLLILGGLFYSAGALVYAFRRPDPVPAVFGYHEVFHALVIAAAFTHWAVVAFYVLPHAA